jgi:hypothetical protein
LPVAYVKIPSTSTVQLKDILELQQNWNSPCSPSQRVEPDHSRSARQEAETAEPADFAEPAPPASVVPSRSAERPQFSAAGYAQIEARVRRRRIDRCLVNARQAIADGRLADAEAAIDEVRELDPGEPALAEVAADLAASKPNPAGWDRIAVENRTTVDNLMAVEDPVGDASIADPMDIGNHVLDTHRMSEADDMAAGGHRGVWIAAAALVVVVAAFVAWPRDRMADPLQAPRSASSAPLVAPTAPPQTAESFTAPPAPLAFEPATPAGPAASPPAAPIPAPPAVPLPAPPERSVQTLPAPRETDIGPPSSTTVAPPPEARQPVHELPPRLADGPIPLTVPERAAEPSPTASAAAPPAVLPLPSAIEPAPPPAPVAAAPPASMIDDAAMVRDTLQRYRRAYSGLDARLAHAVYPILDEAALAHAFAGLRSQTFEFDSCSVDVRGESARAICRGSARYVPNIGSRAPRTDRRVWTFTLNKAADGDWKIASARTDQ